MGAAFIKVKLSRFLAGKTLARDVFLEMPRNGKVLRLAALGDQMRTELLERLASRKVEFLLVSELKKGETGEACDLYELVPAGLQAVQHPTPSASNDHARTTTAPSVPEEEKSSSEATRLQEPASVRLANGSEEAGGGAVKSAPQDAERERSVSPAIQNPAPASSFEEDRLLEAVTRVSGTSGEVESETRLRSREAAQEDRALISGLQETFEDIARLAADEADRIGGATAKALRAGLEESLSAFASEVQDSPVTAIIAASTAMEECVTAFAQSASTEQETALASDMRAAVESARQRFTAAAAKVTKEESFTGNSESTFEKRFTAEKISTDTTEIHRTKAEQLVTKDLEILLTKPDGDPDSSTAAEGHSLTVVPGENHPPPEHSSNARAAAYKELPANAARLAALLAHTLGYSSSRYLSDLSLAVIIYFSRKDGTLSSDLALPSLARSVLQKPSTIEDQALEDSLEIIRLLEAYFDNPDCDRSLRDFSRRVFRDTLSNLRGRPDGINPWNEARWAQAVDRGHSIEAQSVCGRASALALKTSKELQL